MLAEKTRAHDKGPNQEIGHEDRARIREELEAQLKPGIICEGLFCHADHTEDVFREMLKMKKFWLIPLVQCITADQELLMGKDFWDTRRHVKVEADGLWKEEKKANLPKVKFPDSLYIRAACQHRSMAAHCAGVCAFEEFELTTTWLMTNKLWETLPCWAAPTWGDFLEADKYIALEVARACRGGIQPQYWGYPVAWAIPKVLDMNLLTILMAPKQIVVGGRSGTSSQGSGAAQPSMPPEEPSGDLLESNTENPGPKNKGKSATRCR